MRLTNAPLNACLAFTALIASCKGEVTAPPKPASIVASPTGTIAGTVNGLVQPSPTFSVLDDKGNAIDKVAVTITVGGGGTLTNAAKTSGPAATSVGSWVLGPSPGTNTLSIAVAGLPPKVLTAEAKPAYLVDLRFFGPPVAAPIEAAFQAAKMRLETVIIADIPNVSVTALEVGGCGVTAPPLSEIIDDIIIYATVKEIDGVGKVLGSSGPCFVRTVGGLSLIAVMNFDVADLQGLITDGRLNDVILHEMMHAVGFGTLWADKGQVAGAGTASVAFIGLQAVAGCQFHGGTGANQCASTVPVEATSGPGTRDVHWRELTSATGVGFRSELMTGFVSSPGVPNPLSRISIGSLGDIGYSVNELVADSYTVPTFVPPPAAFLSAETLRPGELELRDAIVEPIASVDANGRVTLFIRRP